MHKKVQVVALMKILLMDRDLMQDLMKAMTRDMMLAKPLAKAEDIVLVSMMVKTIWKL